MHLNMHNIISQLNGTRAQQEKNTLTEKNLMDMRKKSWKYEKTRIFGFFPDEVVCLMYLVIVVIYAQLPFFWLRIFDAIYCWIHNNICFHSVFGQCS